MTAHPFDHHHRNSPDNRFAYDISVVRWDGAQWAGTLADPEATGNARSLPFDRPVRAVADGKVVACRRSAPDNDPGKVEHRDGNVLQIQHTVDVFDQARSEYVTYMQLRQDSIPQDLCPLVCPPETPGCNPVAEGVDPDGNALPQPIPVSAGQFIGRVDNPGVSTGPHLHVHLTTGAGETAGSHPMLFHGVLLVPADAAPDEAAPLPVNVKEVGHGSLAMPTG